jgi:hypothetical protein
MIAAGSNMAKLLEHPPHRKGDLDCAATARSPTVAARLNSSPLLNPDEPPLKCASSIEAAGIGSSTMRPKGHLKPSIPIGSPEVSYSSLRVQQERVSSSISGLP